MPIGHVVPTIAAKSFSCPHCGALASQHWYDVYADQRTPKNPPKVVDKSDVEELRSRITETDDHVLRDLHKKWLPKYERLSLGLPFLETRLKNAYVAYDVSNLIISRCFSCAKIAIWRYDTLLYPPNKYDVLPNPDLDPSIQADFEEARTVVEASPRSAAALLRLCVQKLCNQLGQPGKNINTDIGSLVAAGLPATIQKALDLVRVIGNK